MSSPSRDNIPALDATIEIQRRVARPETSAWVEANAGAGKTTVLTNRVIRLLLAGASPANILCITFTKAAAAEMKGRLFEQLGHWALMPDADLAQEFQKLDPVLATPPEALSQARKLFAQTLETPGGLKIQTIHSFCESILRRFPLEANISPAFKILEDTEAADLRQSIIDSWAVELPPSSHREQPSPSLFCTVLGEIGKSNLLKYLYQLIKARTDILYRIEEAGGRAAYLEKIATSCGISSSTEMADIWTAYKKTVDVEEFKSLEAILRTQGGKRGMARADIFNKISQSENAIDIFNLARETFLSQAGTRFGEKYLYTVGLEKISPGTKDRLISLQTTFFDFFQQALTVRDVERTQHLMALAIDIITAYQDAKHKRGFLDFDDLISITAHLFNSAGADWVLYKLDTGLDHILLDEAQDTSATQWDVVMAPLREFFSGAGQIKHKRTAFIVGDEKQSIYSFNGADIDLFRRYQDTVNSLGSLEKPILTETIGLSFRSAEPVLNFVDTLFNDSEAREGVLGPDITLKHGVYRTGEAGHVEIWPLVKTEQTPDIRPWDAPLDTQGEQSPSVILARMIITKIKALLSGEILAPKGRPIAPKDILILFRRRSAIFHEVLKQLVEAGIPTSGADRLKIKDNILIQDMICAAQFILQPSDELSLATFLKSPFCGFSEEELYTLAYGRKSGLWHCLQNDVSDKSVAATQLLRTIRRTALLEGPFSFFTQLLEYSSVPAFQSGWVRAKERLGETIIDPVTEFLNEALMYESKKTRSLQGFLHYFSSLNTTIKRDLNNTDAAIRLMTVHGAKGLQAPIVFLADAGLKMYKKIDQLKALPDPNLKGMLSYPGYFLYSDQSKYQDINWGKAISPQSQNATDIFIRSAEQESKRLLYVAATRAEYQLYITGWQDNDKHQTWHSLAEKAFEKLTEQGRVHSLESTDTTSPSGARYIDCPQIRPIGKIPSASASASAPIPSPPRWLHEHSPAEKPNKMFSPSNILGEHYTTSERATATGPDEGDGITILPDPTGTRLTPLLINRDSNKQITAISPLARGITLHKLLELLPDINAAERSRAAMEIILKNHPGISPSIADSWVAEVTNVLEDPAFKEVFSQQGRAEVSVMGQLSFKGTAHLFSGQIDRLVIKDERVLIVDYKTNRPPPAKAADVAPIYLEQLAAYRALIQEIYPDKQINCALLWTYVSVLMPIPDRLLDAAYRRLAEKLV